MTVGRRRVAAWQVALACLLAIQPVLDWAIPLRLVYNHRMAYSVLKDNIENIEPVLGLVRREIERQRLRDYVIILGDSVAYSGPGGPEQALSRYLDDMGRSRGGPRVFNFAIPAAQMGDVYTMILKLREYGISTRYLIVNLTYAGFVAREPNPPIVYWLPHDLARLDPEAYRHVLPALQASTENKEPPGDVSRDFEVFLQRNVYPYIPVMKYRDYLRAALFRRAGVPEPEGGDPRPWYEKPWLDHLLRQPVFARAYDPRPFVTDECNLNVYFLRRIAAVQEGNHTLFFLSPVNQDLLTDLLHRPEYRENVKRIDRVLASICEQHAGARYLNLEQALDSNLFCDNLHLTSEGYARLAAILWDRFVSTLPGHPRPVSEAPGHQAQPACDAPDRLANQPDRQWERARLGPAGD